MASNNFNYDAISQLVKKEALHEMYETIACKNFSQRRLKTRAVRNEQVGGNKNSSPDLATLIAKIEIEDSLPISKNTKLMDLIEDLMPWRKGPFNFDDFTIESEWNSLLKWQRIEDTLEKKIPAKTTTLNVLDIGCNNGYFLFKIAGLLQAKQLQDQLPFDWAKGIFLIGIDPTYLYQLQYQLIKKIKAFLISKKSLNSAVLLERMHFLPLGFQQLHYFKPSFDLALCMGITYHHPHPIAVVQSVYKILKKGGSAIFECMGVEDTRIDRQSPQLSLCFLPEKTYLGKKGFWFMPTLAGLKAMLKRCGFDCQTITSVKLAGNEQQTSRHSPYASLSQGLAKEKQTTVEGHPPPERHYVIAQKK